MADPEALNEIVAAPDPVALRLGQPVDIQLVPVSKSPDAVNAADAVDDVADPFLVTFERPYDAENPLDWPAGRKWMVTDVLSATGFCRIMVSTIMAPALPTIAAELRMSSTEAAMALSSYLLATAFGPLITGPLSEVYGRQVVLHASNIWFLVWNAACGFAHSKGTLIASRFLAGLGASAIYALAGGVLGDIWRPEQRGRSLGAYLLIPLLGSAVGPIIGGVITVHATWRWMFWSTSVFQGAMVAVALFSFHESYAPLLLRRRAARRRRETSDDRYRSPEEERARLSENSENISHDNRLPGRAARLAQVTQLMHRLRRVLMRPLRLLACHPIIQVSSVLAALNYGLLYIALSTYSEMWTVQYGETIEISGLHYLAVAGGELVASQVGGPLMDVLYRRRVRAAQRITLSTATTTTTITPEARIPLMYPSMLLSWAGLVMYGWTAQYRLHWLAVDAAVFVMSFGLQLSGLPITAYVIDVYGDQTSSAMAANQFLKSLAAFLFPLFAPSMYQALGYGWANVVLALVWVVISVPLVMYLGRFGANLRARATAVY
ncbi:hypothetical protein SCUCBS95973_006545 [Sporothrix curviconia]|uniref:Major facilitator superfamily (MFS) profile domain-containing protein n=1 Tax=Sporothrix curviconia TaxID=1260050 RepID=A0ABP0C608_9PEZI